MIEVETSRASYELFLALTGHAFDSNSTDANRDHGFYWAMRWLATQILGKSWMLWVAL